MLALEPGDHIGTRFASPSQFTATTIAFAEQAIAAAAQVIIFPGDPHPDTLTDFQDHLIRQGRTIADAVRSGQIRIADSRQVQLAPGRFDPAYLHDLYTAATGQAISAGYRGLWVSVDMSWAADTDPDVLTAFEADAFSLFTSHQLTAICLYDTRIFSELRVAAACQAHPAAIDGAAPLRHDRLHDRGTLRLSGDTDIANHIAFTALTRSLQPGDTLDITAMTFIDVRGLARIVDLEGQVPGLRINATGRQLHLLDLIRTGLAQPPRVSVA